MWDKGVVCGEAVGFLYGPKGWTTHTFVPDPSDIMNSPGNPGREVLPVLLKKECPRTRTPTSQHGSAALGLGVPTPADGQSGFPGTPAEELPGQLTPWTSGSSRAVALQDGAEAPSSREKEATDPAGPAPSRHYSNTHRPKAGPKGARGEGQSSIR